jgi:hypothetical protein
MLVDEGVEAFSDFEFTVVFACAKEEVLLQEIKINAADKTKVSAVNE